MNKEFTKDGYVFKKNFLNNSDKKKIYSFLKKKSWRKCQLFEKKIYKFRKSGFS